MKKGLFYLIIAVLTSTVAIATEITNPFYISTKGKITSETNISYQEFHVQKLINGFNDYRSRMVLHQRLPF